MPSLFNLQDTQQVIERINKLSPTSTPQWGKMTVTQMLAHLQPPFMVTSGELRLKRGLMGMLFGKMAKKQLLADKAIKKNLPTDKNFLVKDTGSFDEEKKKLIEMVKKFQANGSGKLSKDPHPFFGKLSADEWDLLQWKHLDHHLTQFGA